MKKGSLPRARLHGLDTWRVLLLLIGPVMHSGEMVSTEYHRVQWIDTIIEASHSFRMAAFFTISGFLLHYRGALLRPGWTLGRMKELLIPAFSVWALLMVPLTVILHLRENKILNIFETYHLWFLVDLAIMTMIVLLIEQSRYGETIRQGSFKSLITLSLLSVPAFLVGIKGAAIFSWSLWSLGLSMLPFYLVFFLFGYVTASTEQVISFFKNSNYPVIGITSLIVCLSIYNLGYKMWLPPMQAHKAYRMLYYSSKAVAAVGMTGFILASALRLQTSYFFTRYLRSAAFTIYLVHYPVVRIVGYGAWTKEYSDTSVFFTIAGSAIIVSLLFHELIVRRHPSMTLLFNGVPRSSKRVPDGTPSKKV